MAPTQPSKRPSLRARPSRPSRPPTTTTTTTTAPTPRTKKAKQHTRRTTFLSRITKPAPTPATPLTRRRRRRGAPPTQLALDSLASALDDAAAATTTTQPKSAGSKTIKSRPGAMKRKEQVVRSECERFGKNLAIMAAGVAATATVEGAGRGPSTWEALRGFIEGTMERKEEFVKKAEEGEEMVL